MSRSWEPEEEFKLLVLIAKTRETRISPTTWQKIAITMGDGYTAESVCARWQIMREECVDIFAKPSGPHANTFTTVNTFARSSSTAETAEKKRKAPDSGKEDHADHAKQQKLMAEEDGDEAFEDEEFVFVEDEEMVPYDGKILDQYGP